MLNVITPSETKERLLRAIGAIEKNDPRLKEELRRMRRSDKYLDEARSLEGFGGALESMDGGMALETIVLRVGRPVLEIHDSAAVLEFRDVESAVWRDKLTRAQNLLTPAITAVGRIELENDPRFDWVGTGWLIDKDLIVTNRHVAEIFSEKRGNGSNFVFKTGKGGMPVRGFIDFLEEAGRTDALTFQFAEVLYIEPSPGPDMALIRVRPSRVDRMPDHIKLSATAPQRQQDVAVIGYPARDSRIPDQQLMLNIFGDVYDKKRLAPGQIIASSDNELQHDCSTLGGNSGSVVLDLKSCEAVGLHFAGRFLEANYAVPAAIIAQRARRWNGKPSTGRNDVVDTPDYSTGSPALQMPATGASTSFTIPIQITVTVGNAGAQVQLGKTNGHPTLTGEEEGEAFITEANPDDYNNRTGYDPHFLGTEVPLPILLPHSKRKDILKLTGSDESELKYTHFSVMMSKSRRQCFFSACNIDGITSVGMKRGAWRLDPRIPVNAQIMKECYGNPPKFSRGHMTRREDPIWGTKAEARQGNDDSMHVTNTVPQMQPMNAGIWLELENYALQNARKDDMRISVFTGPIFKTNDPIRFGVKIPLAFWKVIAFIHDETGELCATGYSISQKNFLPEEEFIFGEHSTAQKPISWIEAQTGLSFGDLAELDPLNTSEESFEMPLESLQQIRFF
ncbi:MAG TPA: DNA/RNA non-specific endonuclease [Chitinophaga sp.]|nr:DNA/RNA non-specific endonuclease [Chitinophaga sp.]